MKKIASLAIAAALVLGASAQSEAAVSGSGYFMATGEFRNNANYAEDGGSSNYKMYERLQLTLLGQSENVTANFTVRVPNYGKQEMVGGAPTVDGYTRGSQLNPQLRIASLTFNLPNTPLSVIVGQHPFAFPGFENPLFDASFPGIQVKAALSSVTPTFAYWLEDNIGGRDQHSVHAQVAVALNDSTMLTPYGGFTDKLGGGISYAGLVFDTNIDTIAVGASTIYKMQDSSSSLSNLFFEGHFAIDLGMMRPGILAWYGMVWKARTVQQLLLSNLHGLCLVALVDGIIVMTSTMAVKIYQHSLLVHMKTHSQALALLQM